MRRDGGLWSIQAKAYDPKREIPKKGVDSWLSDSSRPKVTYRLLVATTNLLGPNAKATIKGQAISVGTRLRTELEEADVIWPRSLRDLHAPKPEPKSPLLHQVEALADVVTKFQEHDRGQLISATGTGKTLTALSSRKRSMPIACWFWSPRLPWWDRTWASLWPTRRWTSRLLWGLRMSAKGMTSP